MTKGFDLSFWYRLRKPAFTCDKNSCYPKVGVRKESLMKHCQRMTEKMLQRG